MSLQTLSVTVYAPLHCSQPSVEDVDGYDYVSVDAEDYQCNSCSKVLIRNAFRAKCCGKHYCERCIKKFRDEKTACPHCREDGFQVALKCKPSAQYTRHAKSAALPSHYALRMDVTCYSRA